MATQSRAQRYIDLREHYNQKYLALYFQRHFTSDRDERQAIGRRKTLDALVHDLEPIVPGMRPAQVGERVLRILDRLAEDKATWLVNSIKKRHQFHINELGEWTAEGAIAQIDEVIPELLHGLAARSSPAPQVHGRFFQFFGQLAPFEEIDVRRWQERWNGDCRGDWYQDVAICCVRQPDTLPEQLVRALGPGSHERPTMLWMREGTSNTLPSAGDIVVSMLSGAAWVMTDAGIESVAAPFQTEPSVGTQE